MGKIKKRPSAGNLQQNSTWLHTWAALRHLLFWCLCLSTDDLVDKALFILHFHQNCSEIGAGKVGFGLLWS